LGLTKTVESIDTESYIAYNLTHIGRKQIGPVFCGAGNGKQRFNGRSMGADASQHISRREGFK